MRFVIRWLVSAISVAAAVLLVPGFRVEGNAFVAIVVAALVIGFVNATIGLLLKIGAFGCIVMTLGLFNLVINAALLWVSVWMLENWFCVAERNRGGRQRLLALLLGSARDQHSLRCPELLRTRRGRRARVVATSSGAETPSGDWTASRPRA